MAKTPEERARELWESKQPDWIEGDGYGNITELHDEKAINDIAAAIREAVEEEREACAKLCESTADDRDVGTEGALECAEAIRART